MNGFRNRGPHNLTVETPSKRTTNWNPNRTADATIPKHPRAYAATPTCAVRASGKRRSTPT